MNVTQPKLLTAGQVALQLNLSVSRVYKLAENREIDSVRIGLGTVRFTQAQVDAFIAARSIPAVGAE